MLGAPGAGVSVGGTGVLVAGTGEGVWVGGTGVLDGTDVGVGGCGMMKATEALAVRPPSLVTSARRICAPGSRSAGSRLNS